VIVPHPDDEAYALGGTIARLTRAGVPTHVVFATDGEAGQWRESPTASPTEIGNARRREAVASCRVLGVQSTDFMELPDGELDALGELHSRVREVIDSARPSVVITLGEDGVYGHPDHLALTNAILQALKENPSSRRRQRASVDAGSSSTNDASYETATPALLLTHFPRETFARVRRATKKLTRGPRDQQWTPTAAAVGTLVREAPASWTHEVDITETADLKVRALAAHRTQLRGGDPATFLGGVIEHLCTHERFVLAHGSAPLPRPLNEIFATRTQRQSRARRPGSA